MFTPFTIPKPPLTLKASKATATRDLAELVDLGILKGHGDGRSTHYELELGKLRGRSALNPESTQSL